MENKERASQELYMGTLVFRQVAFRVETFDRLKAIQRELEASEGRTVTNAETIAAALARWPLRGD